ncbi:DUF4391 domain-containing protein [Sarcina ventriculi]|uniref:DUF4391 domain-containing protein n=1 Tax=Sarcina ventriculi TaxID=1267 RepID=UPI001C127EA4|nr:DUF4391 domain-containing protein [Sarcina ventriculi]MBU5322067.1 DUF4391 domain-containing protein [Sarcina ventriculi]
MRNLPKKYEVNKKIDKKNFLSSDLKPNEKKKLKESLKKVTLTHQIQGEEIPSIINNEYNCQVILFLDVELDSIKNAKFISEIIQNQFKPFCVINIYDENKQRYSFAYKRLNIQENQNIIIEYSILTKESSLFFVDETKELIDKYLDYEKILLRDNKLNFYLEIMTKAYIISNIRDLETLMKSNVWYNHRKVKGLFSLLIDLEKLKAFSIKTKVMKDKVAINKDIKIINEKIKNLI